MQPYEAEGAGRARSRPCCYPRVIVNLPATALLTPREAALYIATTPDVLRTWRATGRGPRFKGRGHFIRYQKASLDEFMSAHDRE